MIPSKCLGKVFSEILPWSKLHRILAREPIIPHGEVVDYKETGSVTEELKNLTKGG